MVGAVLAGGQNTRFPYLKGFIETGGSTIIARNIGLLVEVAGNVVISANEPEQYFRFGKPLVGDVVVPGGPMAGIYSVLRCTAAEWVLVVACDMPFIEPRLISYIRDRRVGDAAVALFGGMPQPLPGLYGRTALDAMREAIKRGSRSLISLLEVIDTVLIEEDEVRRFDPDGRSFVNINTVEDLKKALEKA